jgi:hypothetical protein
VVRADCDGRVLPTDYCASVSSTLQQDAATLPSVGLDPRNLVPVAGFVTTSAVQAAGLAPSLAVVHGECERGLTVTVWRAPVVTPSRCHWRCRVQARGCTCSVTARSPAAPEAPWLFPPLEQRRT